MQRMESDYINNSNQVVVLGKSDLTISAQTVKSDLPKYWDKAYINRTIDLVKNPKHKMLMMFLWMSGVRITEAVSIQKCDIDFENYTLKVKWLKSRKYHNRILPMHPDLRSILQVYVAAMRWDEKVFPMSRQRAWQLVKKYFNGHPHQFRHSFAVNWLRCGGDIITLHNVLGHSKIQTTMEYLKIVPVDQGKELIKISFRDF
jgi:integrase/recombinase XerD